MSTTSSRLPLSVLRKLQALFPQARPFLMYGLTEAFRSTFLDPEEVDRRPDSIGKAVPNARVLVVRDDGTPCGLERNEDVALRGRSAGRQNRAQRLERSVIRALSVALFC